MTFDLPVISEKKLAVIFDQVLIFCEGFHSLDLSSRPWLFKHWMRYPPDKNLGLVSLILICWIVIYPVDSAIQPGLGIYHLATI